MNWFDLAISSAASWWNHDGWPWISQWLNSPGFAGFAAVLAATLAFAGSRHQSRLNAWWQRIEWALNLYTKPDSTEAERIAGLAAIGALQQSRLAKKPEQDFVREIIDATTLDPLEDGTVSDDLGVVGSPEPEKGFLDPAIAHEDESYSKEEAKGASDDRE